MRTVFVNPRRRGKRRKSRRGVRSRARRTRRNYSSAMSNPRRSRRRSRRRNAGITPFVSNPLIMSPNPRRRRRTRRNALMRSNPLAGLNVKTIVSRGLTYGGGAAVAVAANTLFLNSLENFWARNGLRFGGAVLGAGFLRGELGAATAGAMFYPMMQELAAKFLGGSVSTSTATEADLEALAADLEDVMDDLDESDLSDDDDNMLISDDVDDILS